jgi:hypothetical protein
VIFRCGCYKECCLLRFTQIDCPMPAFSLAGYFLSAIWAGQDRTKTCQHDMHAVITSIAVYESRQKGMKWVTREWPAEKHSYRRMRPFFFTFPLLFLLLLFLFFGAFLFESRSPFVFRIRIGIRITKTAPGVHVSFHGTIALILANLHVSCRICPPRAGVFTQVIMQ